MFINRGLKQGVESKYKNSPIFGCHTIECMKNILKEHPEIQFDANEVSNGVKSVKYRVPKEILLKQ